MDPTPPQSLNSTHSSSSTNNSIQSESDDDPMSTEHPIEARKLRAMFRLPITDVFRTTKCKTLIAYLRTFSSSILVGQSLPDISYTVDNNYCIEFFRSYVIYVTDNRQHMLANISQRQYLNFIRLSMAIWNLTDKYETLCARMATFDIHVYLIRFIIAIDITQDLLQSKQIQTMVLSAVGNLHNIRNKLHYTRSRYRDENIIEYLMPLAALEITRDLISLKTAALLLLAFLVDENENSSLNANDDHIIYILDILSRTLSSPGHFSIYYGYHSLEILQGLRYIASPDTNKRRLINNGVLSSIELILRQDYTECNRDELVAGLELLWALSFCAECLQALKDDGCYLRCRVEYLAKSNEESIVVSAEGILWNINTQRSNSIKTLILQEAKTPNINGHIMISYQHRTQEIMIKIKDALVNDKYKVWMDVDHMRGSFVDAMAEGIQKSSVLLLGMCQAFKDSPHCRQEVKYAYILGIPLVPINLEGGFTPDGWLGLMCATQIFTEFIEPSKFDNGMLQLQDRLGSLGKDGNSVSVGDNYTNGSSHTTHSTSALQELLVAQSQQNGVINRSNSDILVSIKSDPTSFLSSNNKKIPNLEHEVTEPTIGIKPSIIAPQSRLNVLTWTSSHCMSWLVDNNINPDKYSAPLELLNGELLFELAEMRITAPQSYFTIVKEELKLDLIDNLNLCRALRRLDDFP